jgi:hypothetical protein
MSAKEDFINEANKLNKRKGMPELLQYLEETDFFVAPASSKYHGSHPKGLLLHSLSVTDLMKELKILLGLEISDESVLICGLFHDVCKIFFYVEDSEEASSAQMRKLQELCEAKGAKLPPRNERTKAHISKVIDAMLRKVEIPTFKTNYLIKDQLPMGHGEKSVYILQKFIQLTDEEAIAIRWHLGGFDPASGFSSMGNPSIQAFRENKLLALLASSDLAASYTIDEW